MQAGMAQVQEVIMKEAVKTTAANAGISLALLAAGPVGAAIGGLFSALTAISGSRYQRELEDLIKRKQEQLRSYVAAKQLSLNNALDGAYHNAYQHAALLAVSYQPLQVSRADFKSLWTVDGLGIVRQITGEAGYDKAARKVDQMVAEAKAKIDAYADPIIAKVQQPGFQALLGKQIAIEMRKNPEFLDRLRAQGIPPPPSYSAQVSDPSSPAYIPEVVVQFPWTNQNLLILLAGGILASAIAWRAFK